MGHVLSGWDGTNALEAPSDLCACSAMWHFIARYLTNVSFYSLPDVSAAVYFLLSFG